MTVRRPARPRVLLIAFLAVLALVAGAVEGAQAQTRADSLLRAAIRHELAAAGPAGAYAREDWQRVRTVYDTTARPLWIDSAGSAGPLQARANALVEVLSTVDQDGLVRGAYLEQELDAAMREARRDPTSVTSLARVDVLLTSAFVALATDLLTGQIDPRSVNREWYIDPSSIDVDSAVAASLRLASMTEALALLRPVDADYAALMGALSRYRQIVARGGWPEVPRTGVLRPGDIGSARELGALMARLHAEGYMELLPLVPADTGANGQLRGPDRPSVYDTALAGAVAEYQRRHELVVDSIVGPNTRASLNVSAEFRTRQIAANLERHRWLPPERGSRYVLVNVPAFRLRAYDGDREVLAMNVVVGAEYGGRTTPVFSDSMAYVVFRPYWNVPEGIARRELWPLQEEDPGYFARHGYEVVRASWGTYVRQLPAADNALGRVKFIFPNSHNIYLHDTPAQALFDERVRAFSHGCIRVEHPDQLAEFVLGPQGWDIARVRQAMTSGSDDHRVDLERKLPVYIVYFTTFTRDGALHFGNDIYDRDDALVRVLNARAPR